MAILPPVLRAGTRDLPDVPSFVQWLIGEFLTPILVWLETLVYRPLLRRCAEHPLVLLAQWYDPAAVVASCTGFHHAPGTPGRLVGQRQHSLADQLCRPWPDDVNTLCSGGCHDRQFAKLSAVSVATALAD